MFTGFASENTPAIQVHDFFQSLASAGALTSVTLADDCAPIQYFRTGGTASQVVRVYLPTSPVDGKQIRIINAAVGSSRQFISLFTSDVTTNSGSTGTQSVLISIGQGQTVDLCYFSRLSGANGVTPVSGNTGWVSLNQMPASASNNNAVTLGGSSNASTAAFAAVLGGTSNTASGSYAGIVGGQTNTANNSSSGVFVGSSNTASGQDAAIVGGNGHIASGTRSGCLAGRTNTSSGEFSAVLGGESNIAQGLRTATLGGQSNGVTGENAVTVGGALGFATSSLCALIGGRQGTARAIVGNFVYPASDVPVNNARGNQQLATLLLGRQTTDATATVLTSNTSAATTTNQVILPNNSAYAFQGTVIAAKTAAGDTSSWKFEGAIKRGANAASTTLVAAVTPTVIAQDVGAVTWAVAVTADTTNGGIKVEVTGAAATTIRWVCKIETTEVTF